MDNTTLHGILRDELIGQPFSINRYGELLKEYCPKYWYRKKFHEINEYLSVKISSWWLVVGLLLSMMLGSRKFLFHRAEADALREAYETITYLRARSMA